MDAGKRRKQRKMSEILKVHTLYLTVNHGFSLKISIELC